MKEVLRELRYLLESRSTLLWVVTGEERRAERAIAKVAKSLSFTPIMWDCAAGATDLMGRPVKMLQRGDDGETSVESTLPPGLPGAALESIKARERSELWILRDFHAHVEDPVTRRELRNLARDLQDEKDAGKLAAVVVLSPSGEIPLELRGCTQALDWPLPEREEIKAILEGATKVQDVKLGPEQAASVVEAAAGLAADDIAGAFARSLAEHNAVDPAVVVGYKKRIIERERVLAWWPPDPRGLSAIGGLELAKEWVLEQRYALKPGAREFGLRAPRGILLCGVPGCGKSQLAKAIPAALGDYSLLRLDLGSLKGSLMGQSEANIRRAFKMADAMGRVVLWLEEVGKALAGATHAQGGDGGVASDALGEMLFWMQEHTGDALVVGTTNETDLPPEFCRRFDATFFVDLPTRRERAAILEVLLAATGRSLRSDVGGDVDLAQVVQATKGFSGGELEKLVQAALLRAFAAGRELLTDDLFFIAVENRIVPMSRTSGAKIAALRGWAKGRAMPASEPEVEDQEGHDEPFESARFRGVARADA